MLFNLGGPDSLDAVRPFLLNLFSDPAIIRVPQPLRSLLARLIAARRAPVAREIYRRLGGRSPILPETEAQARALEAALGDLGELKAFVAMRYWHPMITETARAVAAYTPQRIVLLSSRHYGNAVRDLLALPEAPHLTSAGASICARPALQRGPTRRCYRTNAPRRS